MVIYEEYRLSHRRNRGHLVKTGWMGLLPILVACLLLSAHGLTAQPALWTALGWGIGLQMIYWSAVALPRLAVRRSAMGTRLALSSDLWFPVFLVAIQGAFTALTLLLLWFAVSNVGFQTSMLQTVLFVVLVLLFPIRRAQVCRFSLNPDPAREVAVAVATYLLAIVCTLFAAITLQELLFPQSAGGGQAAPMGTIFLWVPAGLAIAVCFVLLIERIAKIRPPRRIAKQTGPATKTTTEPVDSL